MNAEPIQNFSGLTGIFAGNGIGSRQNPQCSQCNIRGISDRKPYNIEGGTGKTLFSQCGLLHESVSGEGMFAPGFADRFIFRLVFIFGLHCDLSLPLVFCPVRLGTRVFFRHRFRTNRD